ncbi:beta-L-arabinofuranosidase domain-containing protein [Flavivirga abyssicola]|uniref:beta-L-arabinofuranosidase domain-containing protein n=1 Tax=Flavivirga abyssicola TaxID=3063533 RepID=UPI0026DF4E5A|nr:beta-L-arabinofuranosidase domain-containing protein [Flavivirga sp. MEBiC07777]WVK11658.1 beta-L-arabinofuranosidase domain-containing protein [Flavivirga sp. MEBiC07777]
MLKETFKSVIFLSLFVLLASSCQESNSKKETISKYQPKYELLEVGQVKATGWMLEQMNIDLSEGYLSSFHEICPYIDQDVFNAKRVNSIEKYPGYPKLGTWWGAEEEGYLKDGMLRMAIQSNNKEVLKRAEGWMERLLEYQGEDGYIGMYKDGDELDTRFNHSGDNGELWVQSRIMSPMLAWYEYTNDPRFLEAVERAVSLSIQKYDKSTHFAHPNIQKGSGISHSVGFFDILEWLYRITGKQIYGDFAVRFYADFNESPTKDDEMTIKNLLDENLKFQAHTPHIVEGMYMPHLMAAITGGEDVKKASDMAIKKAWYHFTPGGGIVGDEDVKGREGTADTYREYCALPELVFSLNRVASISGNVSVGDMVERVVFNSAQGARLPDLAALQYLSNDNRVEINSCEHGGRLAYDANRAKCDDKFDPNHFDQGAVCCVTSASRILPYFIDGMWMKTADKPGVVSMYYGPTTVEIEIEGVKVRIEEITNYPFSDEITFKLHVDKPLAFDFKLRIPEGADDIIIVNEDETIVKTKDSDFINLHKNWKNGDVVKIKFPFEVKKIDQPISKSVPRSGYFLQRGPLVYALPFPYELEKTLEYNNTGYYRYEVNTLDKTGWDYAIDKDTEFSLKEIPNADISKPWFKSPVYLEGNLLDINGESKKVKLVPEGCTVLRRVTFPGAK